MTCKYYDCGFCYAPADAKNNSIQGGCFEPEYCATYLMQNKMTEPEIIVERKKYGSSAMDYTMRVYQKLDDETIMIDGVKYQKVEEPKPQTLYEMFCKEHGQFINRDVICEIVERWLPDEDDGDDRYACGWNDCVEKLKLRLK